MRIYRLENTVKHYPWGSTDWIPRLLGKNPSGEPWAELWMGVHSAGPSKTRIKGKSVFLSELTELPFLFKFLAAGRALSIQAHPDIEQARKGFEEENRTGIALSAPERNYRDPSHKPEILCPLSPFTAMAGFREPGEAEELLALVERTGGLRAALKAGYREFLSALFTAGPEERQGLNAAVLEAADKSPPGNEGARRALALCGEFARDYPGDPGILSPLYLNVLELEPFQGVFISPGILHAYVRGFAVECMANSDNVLRGGLTTKHVDMAGLFRILSWSPFKPELLRPEPLRQSGAGGMKSPEALPPGAYGYKIPCTEFSLFLLRGPGAELEAPGDAIVAIIRGRAELAGGLSLRQGETAFIPRREAGEKLSVRGDCTLFAALVPG
ncbi:MAG: mannose-6-phosphate isomerase, class I [Spirochaetaceae bacterium]|jgi:mannose-6-phosphate isomerase|nr:mannose-6-phosphate isomerase, class I [Spirochaetaceae bacterium]